MHANPPDETVRTLLTKARTIVVVGASSDPDRPSHGIFGKLKSAGYRVIPVNPNETEVLGEKAYPSLAEVPGPVDVVDVFRRPEFAPAIAEQAVKLGARALWLQKGVVNEEAARIAENAGLVVVMDACIGVAHSLLRIPKRTAT